MNFKIVETASVYPNVLVYRDRNDDGDIVIIKAFGVVDGVNDYIIEEEIAFGTPHMAIRFISDFSVESENIWCKSK